MNRFNGLVAGTPPFSGGGIGLDCRFSPGGDVVFGGGFIEIVLGLPVLSLSLRTSQPVRRPTSVRIPLLGVRPRPLVRLGTVKGQ